MSGNVILGCVVCVAVGGLVLALGIWQMRTGDVRFLHGYHYANVPDADRLALARESGALDRRDGPLRHGPWLLAPAARPGGVRRRCRPGCRDARANRRDLPRHRQAQWLPLRLMAPPPRRASR